jgi:hypothetical protein
MAVLLFLLLRAPLGRGLVGWLGATWIGESRIDGTPRAGWWSRALLLAALSSAVSAYLILGIVLNLAYPLRSDATVTDWGGPTLLGRWAVHAGGGLVFAMAASWVLPALHALARRWLGDEQSSSSDT